MSEALQPQPASVGVLQKIKQRWCQFRQHYWRALLFDVVALILLFAGISAWQSKHLIVADGQQQAPDFNLVALDGQRYELSQAQGDKALLYFFAPWCHVCGLSASNIEALRAARNDDELDIYMVALSYDSLAEVKAFVDEHQLTVPVLLGHDQQIEDYRIRAFPTYYVVDNNGRVKHRSVGYSTELGLRWRTW
jgi:peroxiredoxin